jgi:hypothetical protein
MNLYIEIENNQSKNHPAFEKNLIQAFGYVPSNWESFIRIDRPDLGVYELMVSEQSTYEKIDGVWTDVWHKRDMTLEEKTSKQQSILALFNSQYQIENWSAWTFDEATCSMKPPIPRPTPIAGVNIDWCGAENAWKVIPDRPVDNNQYKFNFLTWQWVQVVNL